MSHMINNSDIANPLGFQQEIKIQVNDVVRNKKFNPFPDGFDSRDAKNFRDCFQGMETSLELDGKRIFEQMRHCIDMNMLAQRSLIGRIELSTPEEKENLDKLLQNMDAEISNNYKTEVSRSFDAYLNRRLDPQKKMKPIHLKRVTDQIKALFSAKATTAFFSHVLDPHITKKYNGMFMAKEQPSQAIELQIPKFENEPIQIFAKVETIYDQFYQRDSFLPIDLLHPVKLEGCVTYTIPRNRKNATAIASYTLTQERLS